MVKLTVPAVNGEPAQYYLYVGYLRRTGALRSILKISKLLRQPIYESKYCRVRFAKWYK